MPNLTGQQRKVARKFDSVADSRKIRPLVRKALFEAGLVESNLRELGYGDRDSQGPLQQRPSQGWGSPSQVRDSEYAANKFIDTANSVLKRGFRGSAGDLAQAVQRSAFPGRYQQRGKDAVDIIRQFGGYSPDGSAPVDETNTQPTTDVGIANLPQPPQPAISSPKLSTLIDARQKLALPQGADLSVLSTPPPPPVAIEPVAAAQLGQEGGAPLTLEQPQARSAQQVKFDRILKRAEDIDKREHPYLWGGGHVADAKTLKKYDGPLDCSGAVSKVLGIDPRVSGQFETWGKPGEATGKRGVTIYANSGHILMKVGNRFFGTSSANPRGGAGWIPSSKVSKQYLSRFTARHL